ncbi:InlB B-repeat-containing protein, partial [Bifidobacterium miconisargentati]|uniref:InlB B-repeat-containing protein n=1 Tax=Bifidobacterium miconisargentati TaxID=2834437 RepID=UPI001BDD570B
MTGNNKVWRAPLAGLASLAMIATMGVTALSANAAEVTADSEVTLNANGGYFGSDKDKTTDTLKAGDDKSFADNLYTEKLPSYSGRTFTGWYESATYGGQAVDPTTVEAGTTLYAHWTTSSKVVTFELKKTGVTAVKDITGYGDVVKVASGDSVEVRLAGGDKLADWQVPSEDQPGDSKLFQGWDKAVADAKAGDDLKPETVGAGNFKFVFNGSYKVYDQTGKEVNNLTDGVDVAAGTSVADDLSVISYAGKNADGSYNKVVKWTYELSNNTTGEFKFGETKIGEGQSYKLTPAADGFAHAWKVQAGLGDTDSNTRKFFVTDGATFDTAKLSSYTLPLVDGWKANGKWYVTGNAESTAKAYVESPAQTYPLTEFTSSTKVADNTYVAPAFEENPQAADYELTFDPYYDGQPAATVVKIKGDAYLYDQVPTPTREGYKFAGWFATAKRALESENNSDVKNDSERLDTTAGLLDETKTVADLFDTTTEKTFYAGWKLDLNSGDFVKLLRLDNDAKTYTTASFREYDSIRTDLLKTIKKETGVDLKAQLSLTDSALRTFIDKNLKSDDALKYAQVLQDAKNNLVKVANIDTTFGQYGFSDVDALTPHAVDIRYAAKQGIVKGFSDNTYRPSATILRQDFAAMLYRLAGSPAYTVSASDNIFSDVTPATPHYKEIL